jgi:hypothetical protein
LVFAAGAALAGWEGTLARQSPQAHWSIAVVIALAFVAAVIAGLGRQRSRSGQWLHRSGHALVRWRGKVGYASGVAVWVALILAFIGWDLNSFVHQVHYLPTLSYEIGRLTRFIWGRALVFWVWLLFGTAIVVGQLEPTPPSRPTHAGGTQVHGDGHERGQGDGHEPGHGHGREQDR